MKQIFWNIDVKHNSKHDITNEEITDLFTPRSQWQVWLDIEVALAETQAELGMIPSEVAAQISAKANFKSIDADELAKDIAVTRAPIVSLVRALADACGEEGGAYVHWGATTQNVMQTGRIILMKRVHQAIRHRLGNVFLTLAKLAETHAETLTAGRTNNRHALPITFGFKIAAWIEELLRHEERLKDAEGRVFCSLWGGAIGAMHAFGEDGPELNRRLSARLGLKPVRVPSRAGTDHIAEYIMLLALLGTTASKIGRELYGLMSDELAEVYEDLGGDVIGSSTMPQKVNSKVAVRLIAMGARLRSMVPLALEGVQPSHEGDAANNMMLYNVIDQACPLAYETISQLDELLSCLRVRPERMRKNLALSGQLIVAENGMMCLAPHLGRTAAHDVVHHAVEVAMARNVELIDVLMADEAVTSVVPREKLEAALNPENYTGQSAEMARDMAAEARQAHSRLSQS